MTLHKNIVAIKEPRTAKEVRWYFRDDERIKGKRLKSFTVWIDITGTSTGPYTSYFLLDANHYDLIADFE